MSGRDPPAIEVHALGKQFVLPTGADAQRVGGAFARLLGLAKPQRFWALREVSFQVGRGEVLGLLGRNGAGKSTLLRILARVTHPSQGHVRLAGRVGSLLEVGTGFHPDLTGRENVIFAGTVLGMRARAIRARFDAIVAFAEIAPFIDMPVKHYSSGMYMRLAFSVAAHLDTEILLVDEALAVGDQAFQAKCLERIRALVRDGRTVIFVSHTPETVRALCDRALVLAGGTVLFDGAVAPALAAYEAGSAAPAVAPVLDAG